MLQKVHKVCWRYVEEEVLEVEEYSKPERSLQVMALWQVSKRKWREGRRGDGMRERGDRARGEMEGREEREGEGKEREDKGVERRGEGTTG